MKHSKLYWESFINLVSIYNNGCDGNLNIKTHQKNTIILYEVQYFKLKLCT